MDKLNENKLMTHLTEPYKNKLTFLIGQSKSYSIISNFLILPSQIQNELFDPHGLSLPRGTHQVLPSQRTETPRNDSHCHPAYPIFSLLSSSHPGFLHSAVKESKIMKGSFYFGKYGEALNISTLHHIYLKYVDTKEELIKYLTFIHLLDPNKRPIRVFVDDIHQYITLYTSILFVSLRCQQRRQSVSPAGLLPFGQNQPVCGVGNHPGRESLHFPSQ